MEIAKGTVLGRYRVSVPIGSGPVAEIYLGQTLDGDREVAIKVLKKASADDPGLTERFHRQCRVAQRLSHPSVITVHEHGTIAGRPYSVMPLLEPTTLAGILAGSGSLGESRALEITGHVLQTIFLAHRKGLGHGALSTGSLLFDRRGVPIVTGFEIESREGEPIDPRVDLVSVGSILREMLGADAAGQGTPANHSPALVRFLSRATSGDPSLTFGSAREMLTELNHLSPAPVPDQTSPEAADTPAPPLAPAPVPSAGPVAQPVEAGGERRPGPRHQVGADTVICRAPALRPPAASRRYAAWLAGAALVALLVLGSTITLWFRAPPRLTQRAFDAEARQATVTGKTDSECFSQVEYWRATNIREKLRTKRPPLQQAEHRHVLPDLSPDTWYHFRFLFSYKPDGDDDLTASEVLSLVTSPEIQVFNIHAVEHATIAVVTWETTLPTDTTVRYGRTDQYEDQRTNPEQRSETIHDISLGGLQPNTVYHYQVVASDPRGRCRVKKSDDLTFHTAREDVDPGDPKVNSHLINLTKSYVDKLTRLTPDERTRMRRSSVRLPDSPYSSLSRESKKNLLQTASDPKDETELIRRVYEARTWIRSTPPGTRADDLMAEWESLRCLVHVNRLRAAKKLDALLRSLAARDGTLEDVLRGSPSASPGQTGQR